MNVIDTSRSNTVQAPDANSPIIRIVGVGATGSHIWDAFVSLGYPNLICYDFDEVESHNLNNQTYLFEHVGIPKIEALEAVTLAKHPTAEYTYCNQRVEAADIADWEQGIVILAVDTMAARKELGEAIKENKQLDFFVESRIASKHGNVYAFPNLAFLDWSEWQKTLFSDDDPIGETSPCGGSISVKPTIMVISGLVTWAVLDWVNERAYEFGVNQFCSPPQLGYYDKNTAPVQNQVDSDDSFNADDDALLASLVA